MPQPYYGRNLMLDSVFGSGAPATVYAALAGTEPTKSDTGSTIDEPSGGSYARVAITNNATNWPAAALGLKTNGATITFPTATGTWGTMKYVVICTAASGGSVIAIAKLSIARLITNGKTAWFDAGLLSFVMLDIAEV